MKVEECSGRTLAFVGDAVWSLLVRRELVKSGQGKGKKLQDLAVHFVSAKAQASFYDLLHEEGFFEEEEEEWYHRGRNSSTGTVPKNTPVQIYRKSSGFEAIIGGLELRENWARIEQIWHKVWDNEEGKSWDN